MPGRGRDSSGTNAQIRKIRPSHNDAARERGWTAESVTIEAGAHGFTARTVPHFLKRLGRCKKKINSDCKTISSITARCTYTIYLARDSIDWDTKRELLTEEYAPTATPNPVPGVKLEPLAAIRYNRELDAIASLKMYHSANIVRSL